MLLRLISFRLIRAIATTLSMELELFFYSVILSSGHDIPLFLS